MKRRLHVRLETRPTEEGLESRNDVPKLYGSALIHIRPAPVRKAEPERMYGLVGAVDALCGVNIHLNSPLGGWDAGDYQVNGTQALEFVRERSSSDDYSRMRRTQIMLVALAGKALQPESWLRLPGFMLSILQAVDTNIPLWQLPRLGFALVRAPLFGIDSRVITREMVVPFQTAGGAQVLAPSWNAINPVLLEMFGR